MLFRHRLLSGGMPFDFVQIYFGIQTIFSRHSSTTDTPQSTGGSGMKRQRRLTRKAAATDESAPVASQIVLSADRLNIFKAHLSTFIDRQPSVTTQEVFDYMKEHDSTFNEDEIRMALAKMQDENQIMLAGEIVIRI